MLYVLRHGLTEWNAIKRLQGRSDIPLNDEGRQMADEANSAYADVHFDVCYCSPLVRARETAERVLAGRDTPILFDDRLKEMCFGVMEGVQNAAKIPDSPIRTFFKEPAKYNSPEGGESFEELFARTGEFLDEVVYPLLEEGKDVLIVGHGAMNSSILCQVKKYPLEDFWKDGIENCKLMKLM